MVAPLPAPSIAAGMTRPRRLVQSGILLTEAHASAFHVPADFKFFEQSNRRRLNAEDSGDLGRAPAWWHEMCLLEPRGIVRAPGARVELHSRGFRAIEATRSLAQPPRVMEGKGS